MDGSHGDGGQRDGSTSTWSARVWLFLCSTTGGTLCGALLAGVGLLAFWRSRSAAPNVDVDKLPSVTLASANVNAVNTINQAGLRLQLFLLSPYALGVTDWKIGDASVYAYRCLDPQKHEPRGCPTAPTVEVEVVGRSEPDHAIVQRRDALAGLHWLHWTGLELYRRNEVQVFTLVKPEDLRTSWSMPRLMYITGYIPMPDNFVDLANVAQAELSYVGEETLDVPAGRFDCERFQAAIDNQALDLWASPAARPLGIVKLRSSSEELVLTESTSGPTEVVVAPPMNMLVEGVATMANGCVSCHEFGDCHTLLDPPR